MLGVQEVSGMVGHSVGELGCAYADGSLTAEQTVLSAYWRGKAVQEASLPPGAMAAVGKYELIVISLFSCNIIIHLFIYLFIYLFVILN